MYLNTDPIFERTHIAFLLRRANVQHRHEIVGHLARRRPLVTENLRGALQGAKNSLCERVQKHLGKPINRPILGLAL